MLTESAINNLESSLAGQLLRPSNEAYNTARKIFNTMIDRRPALIVRCTEVSDVVASVKFAREHDLVLSVHGGGHSVAGNAVCDGGLMIDLSQTKGIRVDVRRQTAQAQPGLTLGEFDRGTHAFGLATTLGIVSDTGIAGLTLGGGIGWLNGKYGLACDSVISFDVVTADGELLTASASENEDLYWALRGGSGNFGIVTSFQYQLHPVGPVLGGMVVHPFKECKTALQFFLEFSASCPDELSTMPGVLTLPDGTPAVALALCYCGSLDEGERVLRPLRFFGSPLADLIKPISYVELQSMLDGAFPNGRQQYWKASFTPDPGDAGIETIVEFMSQKPSPFTIAYLQQLHGAAGRVPPAETAFCHRGNHYDFGILSQWDSPAANDQNIAWTRDFFEAMQPYLERGVYVNNLGEEGDDRIRAAYGINYERLATLKTKYDPTNLFRMNANIRPKPAEPVAISA